MLSVQISFSEIAQYACFGKKQYWNNEKEIQQKSVLLFSNI